MVCIETAYTTVEWSGSFGPLSFRWGTTLQYPTLICDGALCSMMDIELTTLLCVLKTWDFHYDDVIMGEIASQITSITIVYSAVYSGSDQSKHQSSASLAFVWGIHRGPVNSPHKWPVTRKMFPFDDVIMFDTRLNTRGEFPWWVLPGW